MSSACARVLRNLLLVLLGLFVGLLAGEGVARLYFAMAPTPPDSYYIADPDAGFLRRPHPPSSYQDNPDKYINSFGFHDREHPIAKPDGTYRILGIGDSFVYGVVPLEDNFLRVAEARIAEQLAGEFIEAEMMLMGLGNYSPENEVGVLRSHGLNLDPDLVVLNFFVGNDVTSIPLRAKVFRGRIYFVGSPYPVVHFLRHSLLFVLAEKTFLSRKRRAVLRHLLWRGARERDHAGSIPGQEAPSTAFPDPVLTRGYFHHQTKCLPVYLRHPNRRIRRLWEEAEGYLREFDALCTEAGVPWVLHIIPAEIQVDPQVREAVLQWFSLPADRYDFDLPQRRLRAFGEAHGIPVLDPLPELRRMHRPEARLYIPNDTHWNIRGNRITGEMLGDFIVACRSGAVP